MNPYDYAKFMPRTSSVTGTLAGANSRNYGPRPDGTMKGEGFLGNVGNVNGPDITEYSIGVNFDGEEALIPTVVPGLTPEELASIRSGNITNEIVKKAVEHARMRKKRGLPFFATPPDKMGM